MLDNETQALLWICEAKNGDYCRIALRALVSDSTFNWQRLLQLANRHGLTPLCHRNSQLLIPKLMPDDIAEKLRLRYQHIAQRNLQMTADCQRIEKTCNQLHIPITHFKGAVLSLQLYNDPTLRYFCDIDALIPKQALKHLHPHLTNLGFQYKFNLTPKQYNYQLRFGKDMPYKHSRNPYALDLHWHFAYYKNRLNPLLTTLQNHLTTITWQNQTFTTLEPHANACYLAFHGGREGWSSLKWLMDFYHCYQLCDSKQLIQLSHELNVPRFVEHAILLCEHFFTNLQPATITDKQSHVCYRLAHALIAQSNNSVLEQRIKKYQLYFRLSPKVGEKWHVLTRCFNTTHFQWRDIQLPDRLFFLYIFIRPFHWIYRFYFKRTPK